MYLRRRGLQSIRAHRGLLQHRELLLIILFDYIPEETLLLDKIGVDLVGVELFFIPVYDGLELMSFSTAG